MNLTDSPTYKPISAKPRRNIAAIAAMLAGSFGLGMARDWSAASEDDKANYPDWWKNMIGYKPDALVASSSGDVVNNGSLEFTDSNIANQRRHIDPRYDMSNHFNSDMSNHFNTDMSNHFSDDMSNHFISNLNGVSDEE